MVDYYVGLTSILSCRVLDLATSAGATGSRVAMMEISSSLEVQCLRLKIKLVLSLLMPMLLALVPKPTLHWVSREDLVSLRICSGLLSMVLV